MNLRDKKSLISLIRKNSRPLIFLINKENTYSDYISNINIVNDFISSIDIDAETSVLEKKWKVFNDNLKEKDRFFNHNFIHLNDMFKKSELPNRKPFFLERYFFMSFKKYCYLKPIKKSSFYKLCKLSEQYGFSSLMIEGDNVYREDKVIRRLKYVLHKLHIYLKTDDRKKIGQGIGFVISDGPHVNNGEFNPFENQYSKNGIIKIFNLCNYSKKDLFRTILHEYIHYIDYKIGQKLRNKISKNIDTKQGFLFSDYTLYERQFMGKFHFYYKSVLNHNLNNEMTEDIKLLHQRDNNYLINFCRNYGIENPELFAKNHYHSFILFINYMEKVHNVDNEAIGSKKNNPIDYFLENLTKLRTKQKRKLTFIMAISREKEEKSLHDILKDLGMFNKKSYIRLREKHCHKDLFIKNPTFFKRSISQSNISGYIKEDCEMLAWGLTGKYNFMNKSNKEIIKNLFDLSDKSFTDIRYQKISYQINKKTRIEKFMECFNIFSLNMTMLKKIK